MEVEWYGPRVVVSDVWCQSSEGTKPMFKWLQPEEPFQINDENHGNAAASWFHHVGLVPRKCLKNLEYTMRKKFNENLWFKYEEFSTIGVPSGMVGSC